MGQANRLAQSLLAILKHAEVGEQTCKEILRLITEEEKIALQRAYGRIEPRNRFKALSSQPLLDGREVNHIFMDESGKSFPEAAQLPQFFALGAVTFSTQEDMEDYTSRADSLKQDFFGTTNITFHEPLMRHHDGPYSFNGDVGKQAGFDAALTELIAASKFVVFGTGVRKHLFQSDFVETRLDAYLPTDVYAVAITMLLERYLDYLAMAAPSKSIGRVTFESIGPKEDAEHQLAYAHLLLDGSQWVAESAFRNWLETGLRFVPKSGSHPMELADMVSRELYEWIRDGCGTVGGRWGLFSQKTYCRGDGLMGKFGVKVFPDSDIRDRIVTHRRTYGAKEQ